MKSILIFISLFLFASQSFALRVECDFRIATWTFGEAYSCFGSIKDNVNQEILEIVNEDKHLPGKNNTDVEGFYIKDQPVTHLPLNIGWRFRNLKGLEFDNCNITTIRSSHLERLSNLIHLAMPKNRIRKIPANFFRFAVNLQWVYFHSNQIANTGLNVLKNLKKLRGFYMVNNGCVSDNAILERSKFLTMMHSMVSKCTPDLEDFVTDTENTECTFPEETSNENPPQDSSSSSSESTQNPKKLYFDGFDD
ncbi:hypothetical protein PVAND_015356 [Polypedilum vanderplanki]|uniref:Uncharacterized protein n=1 Tax=Polypedilum vanderplanki TaxID=319348 RepID=A0A9J6BCT3_POLVA|nr:hypothetical protein PVAND_015356 [Polypedilum vanderplanki]